MPHQCTTCGQAFPDGSKEMLSGCPDCGGNKFQFHPGELPESRAGDEPRSAHADPDLGPDSPAGDSTADSAGTDAGERSHVASAVERAAGTLREFVAERARPDSSPEPARSGAPGAEATPGVDASEEDAEQPETTQATLDALTADDPAGDRGTETAADDSDSAREDAAEAGREAADDVAARWPSVGTEAGVETDGRDGAAGSPEWPDPWSPDDDGDDFIVAPETSGVDDPELDATRPPTDDQDGETTTAGPDQEPPTAGRDAETVESGGPAEDSAQADARTSMVGADELPDGPADGRVVEEPTGERPGLAQLREELNDQFESIKVVAPGQYELNLMELYDREEYIIAIQENGKYVIDVPGTPEAAPSDSTE